MMNPLGPLIVDVVGTTLDDDDRRRLRHPLVGGVILFTRNYQNPEQLRALTQEIHALRDPALVICVDHEGGRVQRFRDGFTVLPAMRTLGEMWDEDRLSAHRAARATGLVLAAELRACGVDFSFTPCLDLDWGRSGVIGRRAFHAQSQAVAELAASLAHGLSLGGMRSCGKHFPGHGWTQADSHLTLPVDDRPLEVILAADILPYVGLGAPVLTAVMPAHVVYTRVDALPAGFSKIWLQEILRGRLGYQGLIVSDDLGMSGADVAGDVTARAEAAFAAGCDLALICNQADWIDHILAHPPMVLPSGARGIEWLRAAVAPLTSAAGAPEGQVPWEAMLDAARRIIPRD